MSDIVECPMCGHVHSISESEIPDNKVVGCTTPRVGFMPCNDCGCTPYMSDECISVRKEEGPATLVTAGEL